MSRWLTDSTPGDFGSVGADIGAWMTWPSACGSPPIQSDAASTPPSCRVAGREREPGCKLAVAVLDLAGSETRPDRRPLYRPIPWSWCSRPLGSPGSFSSRGRLLVACRLGAIGRFRAALDGWVISAFPGSGLPGPGRVGAGRAGLVGRTPGRSPVVTVLDVGAGSGLP